MKWTTTPPTEPGLYWSVVAGDATVVAVEREWAEHPTGDEPLRFSTLGWECPWMMDEAEWWGDRIDPPAGPVKP